MSQPGRVVIVWLSWLIGGICGVIILLVIICYCRLMPRQHKSFDEQYVKENYIIKENHGYTSQEHYHRIKHTEVQVQRHPRPVSYAGDAGRSRGAARGEGRGAPPVHTDDATDVIPPVHQYASSTMLDEVETDKSMEALKTRSLPAFLRPKPRPLSTEDDLQQLYAKVKLSKKYKNRMRSEHAAAIALSKSRAHLHCDDPVIVYDQRTKL